MEMENHRDIQTAAAATADGMESIKTIPKTIGSTIYLLVRICIIIVVVIILFYFIVCVATTMEVMTIVDRTQIVIVTFCPFCTLRTTNSASPIGMHIEQQQLCESMPSNLTSDF